MNILVMQLARFGDFLQTTPLLSSLKRRYPQARLSVLVSQAQAGLAEGNPEVDEVLSVNLKGLEEISRDPDTGLAEKIKLTGHALGFLRQRNFDLVLNLNTSRMAALISELISAGRREGARLANDRHSLLTPVWARYIMRLMSRRRLIRLNLVDLLTGYAGLNLRAAAGLTYRVTGRAGAQATTLLSPAGPRRLVGFQLGSRHLSRQWPAENFAQLAAFLVREEGADIVFLGLREERSSGRAVLDHLNRLAPEAAPRVLNLMGATSLEALGGVLSRLNLLVTTDTGTMHLAAAV
ncbi:MAG: glycosyltransferase family 9 protein, partial [Pseudomonadota bacterium]